MGCVTRILVLRGTTTERLAFTPLDGELVWDTTTKEMFAGDGSTAGGLPLSNLTNEQIQDIVGALIGDSSTIDVTYDDAGNVVTMDVITSALNHQDLNGAGTNTHAQIDSHIANQNNPHIVTITQAIFADANTDISTAELETLSDGSDATTLHNHDSRYYTEAEIDTQQNAQDSSISQNSNDISQEILDRTNADANLQSQITSNDSDIAQNASDIANHIADTGNPHSTTFSQAVSADPSTDITGAEAETLTDGSDASTLHNHDTQYKKEFWQASQTANQTGLTATDTPLEMEQNQNSNNTVFAWDNTLYELTVSKAGTFKFDINVTGDTNTGGRETSQARLQRDTGSGFVDIPLTEAHSQGFGYHRNNASGEDTIDISLLLTVASGHKFRVLVSAPTDGVDLIARGCGMIVEEK